MHRLKSYFFLFIFASITAFNTYAQEGKPFPIFPTFPGGTSAFTRYVSKNLKYPKVAALLGLTGRVNVRFTVEKNGLVTHVVPYNCLGAGCESEAARVISMSPKWKPGLLYGKPTSIEFSVPISFKGDGPVKSTGFSKLKKSNYGFVFYIKRKTYTIDEAEDLLGNSFNPISIEIVENYDNPKYSTPGKKEMYLIVMKKNIYIPHTH